MLTAMHRRGRRRRRLTRNLGVVLAAGVGLGTFVLGDLRAEAAVSGRRGLEIEGARDRRGFYIGGGFGFGGTFFHVDDFLPAMRMDLALGGGVTERFTLGADLHVTPYLARRSGVAFGGDIEATGYLWRGFFVRGALGASGVPRRTGDDEDDGDDLTVGIGGAATVGYEFFLNATAAMAVGLTYDARFLPGDRFPHQTALVGLRFTWF